MDEQAAYHNGSARGGNSKAKNIARNAEIQIISRALRCLGCSWIFLKLNKKGKRQWQAVYHNSLAICGSTAWK